MATKTEQAIERAVRLLPLASVGGYKLGKNYERIMKKYLGPDEKIIIGAKQSYFTSLAPTMMLATNKRLMILRPTFCRLYAGRNIFSTSNISFIQYGTIKSVTFTYGMFLCSINVRAIGIGDCSVEGLRVSDARPLLNFIENVAGYFED